MIHLASRLLALIQTPHGRALRRYQRSPCQVIARLRLSKDIVIDGIINEVASHGIRFRGATTYILEHADDPVVVEVLDLVLPGVIRHTAKEGYGIELEQPIDAATIARLLAEGFIEAA